MVTKIAICGKANSGKNTLANLLSMYLDSKCTKICAFADPIKEIILTTFPQADRSALYGPSYRRKELVPGLLFNGAPVSYRQLLKDFGEWAKRYDGLVWVNALNDKLEAFNGTLFIVSDLRFQVELDYLKSKDFTIINIFRDSQEKSLDNHASEKEQEYFDKHAFDFIIDNNISIEELSNKVRVLCNKI